jgi:hypothetical protein
MGLSKRRQIRREHVVGAEFGSGCAFGVSRRRTSFHELPPSIVEVLRQFFNNLGFPRWRQTYRGQPSADLGFPIRHVGLP